MPPGGSPRYNMGGRSAAVAEVPPKPADDGSRRVYVWWGVGFSFLLVLGLLCGLVIGPLVQTWKVVASYSSEQLSAEEAVARLGGQEQAARKLISCLRHFGWIPGGQRCFWIPTGQGCLDKWHDTVRLLGSCEVPAYAPPFKDRELSEAFNSLAIIDVKGSEQYTIEMVTVKRWVQAKHKEASAAEIERMVKERCPVHTEIITALKEQAQRSRHWAEWFSPDGKLPPLPASAP